MKEKKEFNKEQWAKDKQIQRSDTFSMLDEATESLKDINGLQNYLDIQSRFGYFSVSNALLVTMQCPNATRVGDARYWYKQGATIRRGEKGMNYIESNDYVNSNGEQSKGVNIKSVFDVSQTTMVEKKGITKNVRDLKLINALYKSTGCEIRSSDNLAENTNAMYCEKDNSIYVRSGISSYEAFKAVSIEMMKKEFAGADLPESKKEFLSKCAAYMICKRYNVPTPEITMPKNVFKDMEPKEIRNMMTYPRKAANRVMADIYRSISNKEREAR